MKTASRYHDRQTSPLLLWLVPILIVVAVVGSAAATGEWLVLVAMVPVLVLVSVLIFVFSAMEVTVAGSTLEWAFRGGFWRRSIPLAEIAEVSPVTNAWWFGWGIRRIPGGWLYNVRGRGAVEVVTERGRMVRLGSDNPERLAAAIRQRMP